MTFSGASVWHVVFAALRVPHRNLQRCNVVLLALPLFLSSLPTFVSGFHYTISINKQAWAKGEFWRSGMGSRSEHANAHSLTMLFVVGT